ncbi:MAG: FAD-dependent monooxygenase [Limisphaerales bacterium]
MTSLEAVIKIEKIHSCNTPVAIIGGGPCGLALALQLAQRQIPCVVFEKKAGSLDPSESHGHLASLLPRFSASSVFWRRSTNLAAI